MGDIFDLEVLQRHIAGVGERNADGETFSDLLFSQLKGAFLLVTITLLLAAIKVILDHGDIRVFRRARLDFVRDPLSSVEGFGVLVHNRVTGCDALHLHIGAPSVFVLGVRVDELHELIGGLDRERVAFFIELSFEQILIGLGFVTGRVCQQRTLLEDEFIAVVDIGVRVHCPHTGVGVVLAIKGIRDRPVLVTTRVGEVTGDKRGVQSVVERIIQLNLGVVDRLILRGFVDNNVLVRVDLLNRVGHDARCIFSIVDVLDGLVLNNVAIRVLLDLAVDDNVVLLAQQRLIDDRVFNRVKGLLTIFGQGLRLFALDLFAIGVDSVNMLGKGVGDTVFDSDIELIGDICTRVHFVNLDVLCRDIEVFIIVVIDHTELLHIVCQFAARLTSIECESVADDVPQQHVLAVDVVHEGVEVFLVRLDRRNIRLDDFCFRLSVINDLEGLVLHGRTGWRFHAYLTVQSHDEPALFGVLRKVLLDPVLLELNRNRVVLIVPLHSVCRLGDDLIGSGIEEFQRLLIRLEVRIIRIFDCKLLDRVGTVGRNTQIRGDRVFQPLTGVDRHTVDVRLIAVLVCRGDDFLVWVRSPRENRRRIRRLFTGVPLLRALVEHLDKLAVSVVVILELTADDELDLRVLAKVCSLVKEGLLRHCRGLAVLDLDVELVSDLLAIKIDIDLGLVVEVDVLLRISPVIDNVVVVKIASQVLRDLAVDNSVDGVVHEEHLVVCTDLVGPVRVCRPQAALFIKNPCLVRLRSLSEDRWRVRLLAFVVPLLGTGVDKLFGLAVSVIVVLELTGNDKLDLRVFLQTLGGLEEFGLCCGNGLRTFNLDVELTGDVLTVTEDLGLRCIREVDVLGSPGPVISNAVGLEVVNEPLADVAVDNC